MKITFKILFRVGQKPPGKGKLVIRIIRRYRFRVVDAYNKPEVLNFYQKNGFVCVAAH